MGKKALAHSTVEDTKIQILRYLRSANRRPCSEVELSNHFCHNKYRGRSPCSVNVFTEAVSELQQEGLIDDNGRGYQVASTGSTGPEHNNNTEDSLDLLAGSHA